MKETKHCKMIVMNGLDRLQGHYYCLTDSTVHEEEVELL